MVGTVAPPLLLGFFGMSFLFCLAYIAMYISGIPCSVEMLELLTVHLLVAIRL